MNLQADAHLPWDMLRLIVDCLQCDADGAVAREMLRRTCRAWRHVPELVFRSRANVSYGVAACALLRRGIKAWPAARLVMDEWLMRRKKWGTVESIFRRDRCLAAMAASGDPAFYDLTGRYVSHMCYLTESCLTDSIQPELHVPILQGLVTLPGSDAFAAYMEQVPSKKKRATLYEPLSEYIATVENLACLQCIYPALRALFGVDQYMDMAMTAANHGHFDMVQWIHQQIKSMLLTSVNTKMLLFYSDTVADMPDSSFDKLHVDYLDDIILTATRYNRLSSVRRLRKLAKPGDTYVVRAAIETGNSRVLDELPDSPSLIHELTNPIVAWDIARRGHVELLEYIYKRWPVPDKWASNVMEAAIRGCQVNVFQWFMAMGFDYDYSNCLEDALAKRADTTGRDARFILNFLLERDMT